MLVLVSLGLIAKTFRKDNDFAKWVVWGLLGANISFMLAMYSLGQMTPNATDITLLLVVHETFKTIGSLLFTTTAWYFAFRYYACAQEL